MALLGACQRKTLVQSAILGWGSCRPQLSSQSNRALWSIRAIYYGVSTWDDRGSRFQGKEATYRSLSTCKPVFIPVSSYATKSESVEGFDEENKDDFQLVYFIKYLTPIRFVSLLKVYQSIFVLGVYPVFGYLWSQGLVTDEIFYSAGSMMAFSTAMLVVIAQYFTSVICAVYIDDNREKVKISHLTFRTRRKDVVLNIQDIHPIFDVNPNKKDLYYNIKTFDNKYKFKLFLHHGTVHDQKLLAELLGKML